jgi:hypothetical protein
MKTAASPPRAIEKLALFGRNVTHVGMDRMKSRKYPKMDRGNSD